MISSLTMDTGWREPKSTISPGRLQSTAGLFWAASDSADDFSSSILETAVCLSTLSFCPNSRFISGATVLNSSNKAVISPFLPRRRTLRASISCSFKFFSPAISAIRASIFSLISILFFSIKHFVSTCKYKDFRRQTIEYRLFSEYQQSELEKFAYFCVSTKVME